ncbi:MAG: substrate-binding domain-containing protein [Alphaproteobacteria bacterium]|nr:substrate-binding domain-containing protein [Alphaproteobacteria bacterium]
MKSLIGTFLMALTAFTIGTSETPAQDRDPVDGGLTIYMQLGGNPGGPATLARELGARDAARVLDVNLIEQHSQWNPQRMLQQANEALAGAPDAIIVMGHPGTDAMTGFLKRAKSDGVTVVVGNNNLPGSGASYFGLNNYDAGVNLARLATQEGGLNSGDKVVVYGAFIEGAPGANVAEGSLAALDEAGIAYDKLQWSDEAVQDASLAVPVLVSYLESNPDTRGIIVPGHGGITAFLGKVVRDSGKDAGEIVTAGFDISPAAIDEVKRGYLTLVLDQQPYLQGFMPVVAAVLEVKYGLGGLFLNTGGGVVTKDNVEMIESLVAQGLR